MAKLTATPGELIRQGRIRSGLSREHLAYRAGTSVATVARLELNDQIPRLRILAAICELIDVPISDVAAAQKQMSAA